MRLNNGGLDASPMARRFQSSVNSVSPTSSPLFPEISVVSVIQLSSICNSEDDASPLPPAETSPGARVCAAVMAERRRRTEVPPAHALDQSDVSSCEASLLSQGDSEHLEPLPRHVKQFICRREARGDRTRVQTLLPNDPVKVAARCSYTYSTNSVCVLLKISRDASLRSQSLTLISFNREFKKKRMDKKSRTSPLENYEVTCVCVRAHE
ncbi:hypothetical protein F2P81_022547 [Scophthalmus maximus]|uniref:Uncharacterized protein n=1 Tax=Scophthalmus maximus TaxID=52904 RepID=A0A6A4RSM2_SCOMX|nr:hypothetical protein F2P81_022547 [Scophthalmus maximus]